MTKVKAYAAHKAGVVLQPFEYQLGDIGALDVDIKVKFCGICHSDLSMLKNDWQMTRYPIVPGHEIVGEVAALGHEVKHLKIGQKVGVGWHAHSCQTCSTCLSGDQNLCRSSIGTIVGRHGGFANKVRVQSSWAIPLPDGISLEQAGPLFCGGVTVFNPILQYDIKPTHRVAVVGIGGLGHFAVQFLAKWGCEVTAFTTHPDKSEWIRELGAHFILNSNSVQDLESVRAKYDLILVTINKSLNWELYQAALNVKGKLIFVGAVDEPIQTAAFTLIGGQKIMGGSSVGSPSTMLSMLEFFKRHKMKTMINKFPLSKVNEALEFLEAGQPRFRVVLENDLGE